MILRLPSYYKEFECIADRCQDSCCVGWEIDIDEETFAYYKSLEGPFGDRLRENMTSGEENSFRLKKGRRCPFLNQRNLCDIVLTLGETSLCEICTEYPRFTLEYADVREKCLGISCEEVGRIVFETKDPMTLEETEINEEDWLDDTCYVPEEDDELDPEFSVDEESIEEDGVELEFALDYDEDEELRAKWLQVARNRSLEILQNRKCAIEERICRFLLFAEQVQEQINREDWAGIGEVADAADTFELPADSMEGFSARKCVLDGMEILDEEWRTAIVRVEQVMKENTAEQIREKLDAFMAYYREREYEYEQLMVYFVFRYCMKAVFDYRFLGKAQLAVLSFLTIRDMDMVRYFDQGETFSVADRIDNARIYSKEVEHSEDNLEYLAEEFVFTEEMHPEALCRQVMFV